MSEERPYILRSKKVEEMFYNPNYGDDRICKCGHTYYRHFDTYEEMAAVGCKYCGCYAFEENTDVVLYRCPECHASCDVEDLEVNEVGGPHLCPACGHEGMDPTSDVELTQVTKEDLAHCPYPSCPFPGCDGDHEPPIEDWAALQADEELGEPCRVCGENTETVFNIKLKKTPICESCATSITIQQVTWYAQEMKPVIEQRTRLKEALQNVMGHIDAPIPRRKLNLDEMGRQAIDEARDILREVE